MLPPRALFLGSYPPRECGIATFTKDVVASYDRAFGVSSQVVAIDEPGGEMRRYGPEVIARLSEQDLYSYGAVADIVNRHPADLLNVQHEYGLFGGECGEWLVGLLRGLEKPVVVTMHTVLPEPDETMLRVTRELCASASRVVSLSDTGRQLLETVYGIDPDILRVIHHGVPDVPFQNTDAAKASFGIGQRTVDLDLRPDQPRQRARIRDRGDARSGQTSSRDALLDPRRDAPRRAPPGRRVVSRVAAGKVREYGLQYNVQLVDKYLDFDELVGYLTATDIYLTPYLNPAQIVSGTLAYAVGCGKAIVSTPYLYAQELLAHGRGFLCEFRDSTSIARRLNMLLDDPALRRATERRAYRFGRQMTWPHVSVEYGNLFLELAPPGSLELVSSA